MGIRSEQLPMIPFGDAAEIDGDSTEVTVHTVINAPDWTGDDTLDPALSFPYRLSPQARRSGPHVYQSAMRMSFLLTNSSMPNRPSSRPKPERFTPPNGSSTPSIPTALTKTMPAWI